MTTATPSPPDFGSYCLQCGKSSCQCTSRRSWSPEAGADEVPMMASCRSSYPPPRDSLRFAESHITPNHIPVGDRIRHVIFSLLLFAYGSYGVWVNDLYLPSKRSRGIHLHDVPAWVMYGAILCACLVMLSVVVDHYDKRNNETNYQWFAKIFKYLGLGFFGLSLAMALKIGKPHPTTPVSGLNYESTVQVGNLSPDAATALATDYKNGQINKAFAISDDGSWGWKVGAASVEAATQAAIANCDKLETHSHCSWTDAGQRGFFQFGRRQDCHYSHCNWS